MTDYEIMKTRQALENGITRNHSGKMAGKQSFSTSVRLNPLCQKRSKNPRLVCFHCFAESTINRYSALGQKLERNTEIITREVLPLECFPQINTLDFRFEAFGDIATPEQVVNYFHWAQANPRTFFVLWTKNPHIIQKAMDHYGIEKPANFRIIFSSCHLNSEQAAIILRLFPWIDKIFTVYTAEYAVENDVVINCGGNSCQTCGRCYDPSNTELHIREMLKEQGGLFRKLCKKLGKALQVA